MKAICNPRLTMVRVLCSFKTVFTSTNELWNQRKIRNLFCTSMISLEMMTLKLKVLNLLKLMVGKPKSSSLNNPKRNCSSSPRKISSWVTCMWPGKRLSKHHGKKKINTHSRSSSSATWTNRFTNPMTLNWVTFPNWPCGGTPSTSEYWSCLQGRNSLAKFHMSTTLFADTVTNSYNRAWLCKISATKCTKTGATNCER